MPDKHFLLYRLKTLCLLLLVAATARGFVVTSLPTQSQLPIGNIHCILQDSEGFMWYGTLGGGICRDNGYQIDKFGGGNILCMAEDKRGRIWFGTYNGLFFIDKSNYQVTVTPYKGETSAVMCDSQGRLWASVNGNVICADPDNGGKILEQSLHENVASFYEDSQNTVWILAWSQKIWHYTGGKSLRPFMRKMDVSPTRMVEDRKRGGYWIATWGDGIQFLDKKTHLLTPQPATKLTVDQGNILDMKVDWKRSLVYVSTTDNLYIYRINGKTLTRMDTSPFMSAEKKILDGMWIDHNDNLWVGGFIPTTFILSPASVPILRYSLPQITRQTGYPLIADRCVSDGDCLWISQGRIGLVLYNRRTDKLRIADDLSVNSRLITKKRKQSGVWCANGNVLMSLTSDSQLQVTSRQVCSFNDKVIMIRDMGDYLLVGTTAGLYRLQHPKNVQTVSSFGRPVTLAVADVDGQIYFFVKGRGLYRRSSDNKTRLICKDYNVRSMDMSPDGTLWFGTEDGMVYKLPSGSGRAVMQDKACNPDKTSIIDIHVDYLRHVWILSDQTVREYNPDNGNVRLFHSQDEDIRVSNFYKLECTGDKNVGIGAAGAYIEIAPLPGLNRIVENKDRVIATSFRLSDSLHIMPQGTDRITLSANSSNLVLHVSVNRQLSSGMIAYAYKLNKDGDWIHLPQGSNTIYLDNIPSGDNTLLLKSADEYGRWSDCVTEITVHHSLHWWQTLWAQLLFAAICAGVLLSLWLLNKRIHILSNLQNMRRRLSLNEIEIKEGHEKQALRAEDTMKKMIEYVEANIADADYNVQRLSEDMCMSRTNLYRRIHASTGLSVIEFIRDIRLKQAAQLLGSRPDVTVGAVCKSVGFTSSSYFIKCFKKKFGVTPSEYAKQPPSASP